MLAASKYVQVRRRTLQLCSVHELAILLLPLLR